MNIIALKLVSGEEIIGKVKEQTSVDREGETESIITLSQVRMLLMVPTNQGIGIAVQPWLCSVKVDEDLSIRKSLIMIITSNILQEIENAYLRAVSSIQLVS